MLTCDVAFVFAACVVGFAVMYAYGANVHSYSVAQAAIYGKICISAIVVAGVLSNHITQGMLAIAILDGSTAALVAVGLGCDKRHND